MKSTHWDEQLCCVQCHGKLSYKETQLECSDCYLKYEVTPEDVPIMMTPEDRDLFGTVLQTEPIERMKEEYSGRQNRKLASNLLRALYPPEPVYVDPNAPPLPVADNGTNLWLGGGGLKTEGFINIDLSPFYGVDVVAHAARLPIFDCSCDRIACLALLEHVQNPEEVVREAYRVLKPNGLIEVVVPFCHPYHAYPSDFSRFSREGLAILFASFIDVKIGIRTGPTTTILTFMIYYGKLIFPVHCSNPVRRWINRGIMGAFGWVVAPIRYLDHWINRLPEAHVLANHFYVSGRKP